MVLLKLIKFAVGRLIFRPHAVLCVGTSWFVNKHARIKYAQFIHFDFRFTNLSVRFIDFARVRWFLFFFKSYF